MSYPGRRLPYEVRFGSLNEAPPDYVTHITDAKIILSGSTDTEKEIPFDAREPFERNPSLFEKLTALSLAGIAFPNDHRQYYSPAGLMLSWQEEGKWLHPFQEISWMSRDRWCITLIPPPEIGVRGWSGFTPPKK